MLKLTTPDSGSGGAGMLVTVLTSRSRTSQLKTYDASQPMTAAPVTVPVPLRISNPSSRTPFPSNRSPDEAESIGSP